MLLCTRSLCGKGEGNARAIATSDERAWYRTLLGGKGEGNARAIATLFLFLAPGRASSWKRGRKRESDCNVVVAPGQDGPAEVEKGKETRERLQQKNTIPIHHIYQGGKGEGNARAIATITKANY